MEVLRHMRRFQEKMGNNTIGETRIGGEALICEEHKQNAQYTERRQFMDTNAIRVFLISIWPLAMRQS